MSKKLLEICNVSAVLLLASRDVRQTCHAMPLRRASNFSATTATPLAPPIMTDIRMLSKLKQLMINVYRGKIYPVAISNSKDAVRNVNYLEFIINEFEII